MQPTVSSGTLPISSLLSRILFVFFFFLCAQCSKVNTPVSISYACFSWEVL